MSATRGARWLASRGIPFQLVRYDHAAKGAAFAAQATGVPLGEVVKTLVVEAGEGDFLLVLVPGDRALDLRRLAQALGVKRARLADPSDAERVTGYRVGGITPSAPGVRSPSWSSGRSFAGNGFSSTPAAAG